LAGRVHRYFMFVVLLKSDLVKYKFYDLHTNLMCIIIKIQNKIAIIYSVIFEMGVVLISYNGVAYLLSFEKAQELQMFPKIMMIKDKITLKRYNKSLDKAYVTWYINLCR